MPFSISIVTYMELVQGMRDKRELSKMKKAFAEMEVEVIPLSESISLLASDYVEMYALSHSMEMADAFDCRNLHGTQRNIGNGER